jgi:hypothetical protein
MTKDNWAVYGFAVDWPLFNSSFPASSGVIAPTIVGAAGQDDVTTSNVSVGPAGATVTSFKRLVTSLHRK